MKLFNKKTSNRGFTIIEMIVVIAVLAILVLLGAPRLLGYTQKAELVRIQHDTKVMENEMGVLMLENEVDIGDWENNNKDFNQLIAEDKLFEKEGVAEKVYAKHLTRDGVLNLNKYFRELSSNNSASLDEELGVGGESYPVNELPEDFSVDKTYKVIPEEYSDKIKTKLDGTFYVNSDGKVYYEHGKPIPGEDKDKSLTCPKALPDYEFEHETGTIVKWNGTEQYLTIPSHFLVDGKCWPVRIIGVGAFMRGNFKRVVIPNTVVKIEEDAFKDAIIDEIVIPDSVTDIADEAFSGGGVKEVEVIGEPDRFDPGVFTDTEPTFRRPTPEDLNIIVHPESGTIVSSTRTPSPNRNNDQNQSEDAGGIGGTLIIPKQVEVPGRDEPVRIEKIHKGAFQGDGLIEVHLPYTLKRIEAYAFSGNQLNGIEIPTSVEYIGEYAFSFNQHIHSSSKKVSPTIKSIMIQDVERINNVKLGDIVDGSGNLVNPLDGVEMKEYIWVTDADNFQFEEIEEPGTPEEPSEPEEPTDPGQIGESEGSPLRTEEELDDTWNIITTAEELSNLKDFNKYILMNDIDLAGIEWTPIGDGGGFGTEAFSGTFDGNGFIIKNLTITENHNGTGLFGAVGVNSLITNVALENVDIQGYDSPTGALVGRFVTSSGTSAQGIVENSYSTGVVRGGTGNTGGLIGGVSTNGAGRYIIQNSYSLANVYGEGNVGGLIGRAHSANRGNYSYEAASIRNVYSKGDVTGGENVGGLIGETVILYNSNNATLSGQLSINNTYATGHVESISSSPDVHIGGIYGKVYERVAPNSSNSYWDVETTNQTESAIRIDREERFSKTENGKTTQQMKQQETFSGWDFDEIWEIQEGVSYPTLRNNPER